MDWSVIVVAGLSLLGTVIGSYLASNKTQALLDYRLSLLEEKVEKHNNLVERTYKLESDAKTMWNRIDELKEELKEER